MKKIKDLIVSSPLHKISIDLKAHKEYSKFTKVDDRISDRSTVYCISPYKTATRYLNGCYRPEVSAHEPLHYLSLRELDRNFNDFFVRRLNTLNLKLECSGFFSAYIEELANNPIAADLHYIIILRSPSSWITSAMNFWDQLSDKGIHYHYPNRLFWMKKVGVDLDNLLKVTDSERQIGIKKLEEFYMDFTEKTKLLKNVHYVRIQEIDSILPFLDELIDEKSSPEKSRTLANKQKVFRYKNEELDRRYELLTREFILNTK
jgi:hypothetical protein